LIECAQLDLNDLRDSLIVEPVHLFWERGFDHAGITSDNQTIDKHGAIAFVIADGLRALLQRGHFVGRLTFEYLDVGADFITVRVDAQHMHHQVIASFKKTNTGRWLRASTDLVNARSSRALEGGVGLSIQQRPGTRGGVKSARAKVPCSSFRGA
jgi:hypothetical protein